MQNGRPPMLRAGPWHLILAYAVTVLAPQPSLAQGPSSRPSVYVRTVRIDSILLAFGVDSARVRAAVQDALRDARRLAPKVTDGVPSLDVDVAAPRSMSGGFEPRGFVRLEVGRNLVEAGVASKLLWERTFDRQSLPTWREFGRGTLAEVLRAVNTYLLSRTGGA